VANQVAKTCFLAGVTGGTVLPLKMPPLQPQLLTLLEMMEVPEMMKVMTTIMKNMVWKMSLFLSHQVHGLIWTTWWSHGRPPQIAAITDSNYATPPLLMFVSNIAKKWTVQQQTSLAGSLILVIFTVLAPNKVPVQRSLMQRVGAHSRYTHSQCHRCLISR
jgi:hypothetical protein